MVLGPFGGGTSAVAGVLHHLGVHLGTGFGRLDREPPDTWEDVDLAELCRAAFTEPQGTFRVDPDTFDAGLRDWADAHRRVARAHVRPSGAKHPSLCLAVPRLLQVWRPIVPVVVRRPVGKVVASLRQGGWWTEGQRVATTTKLVEERDRALANVPTVDVDFERLRAEPREAIRLLADQLGLVPEPERLAVAARGIMP